MCINMKEKYLFYGVAVFIVLGALPLPYGYYQLLRFVAFFAFAMAAYFSHLSGKKILSIVLGFAALVFNPFIKIIFSKDVWMVVDVLSGIGLAVWATYFFRKIDNP